MFSRSTAPAHCVSGNDSIGRHCTRCPISWSASAGASTSALLLVPGVRGFLLENADLLVEAIRHLLQGVDGGVVLLNFDGVHRLLAVFGRLLLVVLRSGGRSELTHGIVVLELQAVQVSVHAVVVRLDRFLT